MAELLTSMADADEIAKAVANFAGSLRDCGFEPAAIGACMTSVGFALIQRHAGHARAKDVLATYGDILAADASLKS